MCKSFEFVSVSSGTSRWASYSMYHVPKAYESSHTPQTPLPYAQVDGTLKPSGCQRPKIVGGNYAFVKHDYWEPLHNPLDRLSKLGFSTTRRGQIWRQRQRRTDRGKRLVKSFLSLPVSLGALDLLLAGQPSFENVGPGGEITRVFTIKQ